MRSIRCSAALLATSCFLSTPLFAAITSTNTTVEIEHLKLLLKPLTQEELQIEAEGWRDVLKAQVTAIGEQTIHLDDNADESKSALAKELTELQNERTRQAERMQVVLNALAAKGGDIESLQQYVDVVTRLEVNATDAAGTALALRNWVISKEGGLRWGGNLLKFLAILLITQLAARIAARITGRALGPTQLSALLKNFVSNAVRKVVFLLGLLIALSALGVNVGPLLAGVGVIGFVIGFALQDTLSNFASGFMILLYRPYDVGDVVIAGGINGIVDDMTLVSTRIKTFDNQVVTVPNNSIWGGTITNATGSSTRRVDLTFGIGYTDDIAKAEQVLTQIVSSQDKILTEPAPVIQLHELADSSVNFVVRPWAKTEDYWSVYWSITRAVKERFDAEAISIPYPQRDVHLHPVAGAE